MRKADRSGTTGYEVFARSRRGDPLRHIGSLTAPTDGLARLYARWLYDEERWSELAVVRRAHLLPALEGEGEAVRGEDSHAD
jgi:1,2-phenylacetyl-CoA epoxidase PaaB subunit